MPRYRWTGTHAFRDHANDRTIDPGEELPDDIAEQVAAAHPHQVETVDEGNAEAVADQDDGTEEADVEEEEASDEFDVDEFVEKTAADQVDVIEAGDADPFLTAIRDANAEENDYSTVEEAVDERLGEARE